MAESQSAFMQGPQTFTYASQVGKKDEIKRTKCFQVWIECMNQSTKVLINREINMQKHQQSLRKQNWTRWAKQMSKQPRTTRLPTTTSRFQEYSDRLNNTHERKRT